MDVKIIAAMNTDPLEAIRRGELRQDIYYRLSMMSIRIPPLRERKADIPSFLNIYVNKHNATFHKHIEYVSQDVIAKMQAYPWPGNLRELEHMIVYAMSRVDASQQVLDLKDFKEPLGGGPYPLPDWPPRRRQTDPPAPRPLREAVREYERELIRAALQRVGGNVSQAARELQIPRQTLWRRIQEYGLAPGGCQGP